MVDRCQTLVKTEQMGSPHLDILGEYQKHIIENLELMKHSTDSLEQWLKLWDKALKMNIPSGRINDCFIKYAQSRLDVALFQMDEEDELRKFLDVYCEKSEVFVNKLQDILSTNAFRAIEKCTTYLNLQRLEAGIGENTLKHYGELLSHLFKRNLTDLKETDRESYFHHAVTWPSFSVFVKMYNIYPKAMQTECMEHLNNFMLVIRSICEELCDGTINVHNLQNICKEEDHFRIILQEIQSLSVNKDIVLESISLRRKQLVCYESDLEVVQHFVYVCRNCGGNTDDLSEKIRNYGNLINLSLNQICVEVKVVQGQDAATPNFHIQTRKSGDIKKLDDYCPTVTAFDLNHHQMETMRELKKYTFNGDSFTQLLDTRGQLVEKEKGRKLYVDEMLNEVWEPMKKFWTNLYAELEEGELHFSEFHKYFQTDNVNRLMQELRKHGREKDFSWINQRIHQIEQYRTICNCSKGAEAILKVVHVYDLKGNFDEIKKIQRLTCYADTKMKTLDESLLKTCNILRDVNDEKANCLIMFADCKHLILWLRETMHSIKELQVFVDLAMMSAGEGDMSVARVHCLHSATTGYGPLIFNFDENCSDKVFLEKCKQVWRVLSADFKLPEKLRGTCGNLEWLKSVKKSHGSIEMSSLSQVEAINASGVYVVGYSEVYKPGKKLLLTDVLGLSVNQDCDEKDEPDLTMPEENEKQQNSVGYNYKNLQDLQSRLMLVAGKAKHGNDEVERFIMILDAVVRLGNIYTKLIADGCILFSSWNATFLCDRKRSVCVFINFGHGKEMQTLKGMAEDVANIIPKIAEFLEDCHTKWLSYIDEKRERHYFLNYFSIDQIVILQRELVKIDLEQDPSVLIYPMISAIKHDCTAVDLIMALAQAKQDVILKERSLATHQRTIETETIDETELDEETEELLKQIIENDFPEELAREAIKHNTDFEEALIWCVNREENDKKLKKDTIAMQFAVESREDLHYSGWIQRESMASMTAGLVQQLAINPEKNAFKKLHKALQDLWEKFLTSIASSVSDCLSIEHLCLILERLSVQETVNIERIMSPCFQLGEPNLVIIQESEVYNTVLSIYNYEDDKLLPQSDEVLLCNKHSTLDMVEIFWRRCLFSENDKIYSLVFADALDYDVADKAEKKLKSLMTSQKSKDKRYKLVIMCCAENEKKSVIVRALSKYHRPQLFAVDVQNIRQHLLKQLIIEKTVNERSSASSVDFERSSVRIVKSCRSGVGKTLYKKRMVRDLHEQRLGSKSLHANELTIPLHNKSIDIDEIMSALLEVTLPPTELRPRIFHIDLSHEVQHGVDEFLFQLLVLGCLTNSSGYVWRKSTMDYYIVETLPLMVKDTNTKSAMLTCMHHCLKILPSVMCRSPQENLDILSGGRKPQDFTPHDRLFDKVEFRSTTFQRPYQYLKRLDTNCRLETVNSKFPEGDEKHCLDTLLRHCGVRDPSWSEIHYFVSFLNAQLQDFEVSSFCSAAALQDLPGFAKFVLKFLIQMSRDFSTRSLVVSEESPTPDFQVITKNKEQTDINGMIEQYQMRRTWESSPHPYLFFNLDHHSMTFLGFNIEEKTRNLIDLQTKEILEKNIMEKSLFDALSRNKVDLSENFDALPRQDKILKLCNVMGINVAHDPDPTYELTTDNVKKILAIYMRFRCGIPVIIMGETGCGKTRLVEFMCSLQRPPGLEVQNLILMKVHGGTKASDIIKKVHQAEAVAVHNSKDQQNMDTVLFFDEANTTEAIGAIKEIMCDKTLGGKQKEIHEKLKMVAACNPYRKHSKELIQRLEQAGLGYHVDAEKTTDKLGHVPMRNLVYRVQPLPQSMLPLVWDFGQLDTEVEELYIRQMVLRYIDDRHFPTLPGLDTVVSKVLTVSQDFMRKQKDECSFVSLRDVKRVLQVMSWFYNQTLNEECVFFSKLQKVKNKQKETKLVIESAHSENDLIVDVTRSLVLALGVCYHSCLKKRQQFREAVAKHFVAPLSLPGGADQIEEDILLCQSVFIDNVELAANIAKNTALKENVFMMIVCIELRIPLFLVGKPGSSKSLAKTIVSDAMQGNAAHNDLFRSLKEVKMVSFQCSPLSTPDGILGIFRECAAYQKEMNLNRFVSVVVLDEIGLAEDSPRMPLKTLHPLLEDGCCDDEEPEPHKKVGFIGISNWALDPAKMNRGILVQRDIPDKEELLSSARKICSTNRHVANMIEPMIESLAVSYVELFDMASKEMREFFGLRDFYSLLKMLYGFVYKSTRKPTWLQLKHCVLRNFGGLPEERIQPVDIFARHLVEVVNKNEERTESDPECSPTGMIKACLEGSDEVNSECRYLLLLTENYGALTILQQNFFSMNNAEFIFGSHFPSDQEYTQVCRNINHIKVCMETGSTVILLNLENLYESLYDALNQYYFEFGGERYVDLGLGTHRVKCRVHKKFRLVVVAEKQVVYDRFPIPLINRLEKHFLSINTMLTIEQDELAKALCEWAKHYAEDKSTLRPGQKKEEKNIGDVFIGYHVDTCATILYNIWEKRKSDEQTTEKERKQILIEGKSTLLWCATPAAVSQNGKGTEMEIYTKQQQHESLTDYLYKKMQDYTKQNTYSQITTNSRILSPAEVDDLCTSLQIDKQNVTSLKLQQFYTEQQFSKQIRFFANRKTKSKLLLIIQCDCGDQNAELIACARYSIKRELKNIDVNVHVVLLVQLPGIAGDSFTGFQCGLWHSAHIDDLRNPTMIPPLCAMYGKSAGEILSGMKKTESQTKIDIPTMEKTGSQTNATEKSETPLLDQINLFISSCIHKALACIKDHPSDSQRTTERLTVVLNILEDHVGPMTVLTGIAEHTARIISEKEESNKTVSSTNLLSVVSSKSENIKRAGTFRKCVSQGLESKVVPILAGIMSFIDTNRNLDIFIRKDTENQNWQTKLWLHFINDPELTQLNYTKIVSPQQQELQEVFVKTTSATGKVFQATMPFSWLIYNQIDKTLTNTKKTLHESETNIGLVLKAAEIFKDFPLGNLLSENYGVSTHNFLECYIKDFVHMVHPAKSQDEYNLVCEAVAISCRKLLMGEYGKLLPSLLGCHIAYSSQATRFKNFSHIICVWQACSEKIIQQKESNNLLVTNEENTLDILALQLLIDDLKPAINALNKEETRNEWLQKVCHYRPVVERIFGQSEQDTKNQEFQNEQRRQEGLRQARYKWTRTFIVKLFIENVCISNEEEKTEVIRCMVLWTKLGNSDVNMKTLSTFEKIETYLKQRNEKFLEECFGILGRCSACKNNISSLPMKLPCDDVYCKNCYRDIINVKKQCIQCNESVPENFNPAALHKSQGLDKYNDFRRRCNSFFMEVISQLCFAEGTPPAPEIINKLQSYIIGQSEDERGKKLVSKELTVFQDSIDPTPVVRSFLLQQLMQTSGVDIEEHLTYFFERTSQLVKTTGKQEDLELCLLILQCMEDSLHQQHQYYRDTVKEITIVTNMIRETCRIINKCWSIGILEKIKAIAKIRFALSIVANYVQKVLRIPQGGIPGEVKRLMETAKQLCDDGHCAWPRKYLVKHLCRGFGIDTYQAVQCSYDFLRWIQLPDLKVKECHDRYIVCGDKYKDIRNAVVAVGIRQETIKLQEILNVQNKDQWRPKIMSILALHREVTMHNIYVDEPKFSDEGLNLLKETVLQSTTFKNMDELPSLVMTNKLWKDPKFNIYSEMNLTKQNISCLLTHYMVLMIEIPGKTTLVTPLKNIAMLPEKMVKAYYPTMPQEEAWYVRRVLLEAGKKNDNAVLYKCPNGHLYIIGDCGKPYYEAKCHTCGALIGGQFHKASDGNVKYEGDETATGHILGRVCDRSQKQVVDHDRSLDKETVILIRLLTHMSMFVGCNFNSGAVLESIEVNPKVELPELPDFLLDHIDFDIECLRRILGKSRDDVFLLVHCLLATIMEKHTMSVIGEAIPTNQRELTNNDARIKWEQGFAQRYVTPVFKALNDTLKTCNDKILKDKRLGFDPLLPLLYEVDINVEMLDVKLLQDIPAVWGYRTCVSVEHLTQMLNSSQQQCHVLYLFLEEESVLRALRHIPSILRLQMLLMNKYNRKLNKDEGENLQIDTIKKHFEKDGRSEEFGTLIDDYTEAWECVRQSLESYTCSANGSFVSVNKDHLRRQIDNKTPISFLLPTLRDDGGLCAYMLLRFLLEKQNSFLEKFCQKSNKLFDILPRVHVKEITSAHLISFHPEKDLLPMFFANCNYSFEVGHETKVDYNFVNLERQLTDRFLFSKSVITGIEEIEMFRYRTEFTNALVFDELSQRIKQERISATIQNQIQSELQEIEFSDVCDSLVKLDIGISFLKSVGSNPDSLLFDFMSKILKIEDPFLSSKAQQFTKCKNTLSWWITLSLQREIQQAKSKYNQNQFDSLSDSFKEPLKKEQLETINGIMNSLSLDYIHILLVITFECILLRLDIPDSGNLAKISLQEVLIPYIDSSPYENDRLVDEYLKEAITKLPSDESIEKVTTAQIVDFWKTMNKLLVSKEQLRR
ncbi:E3 ubiquitin-protein ligase RNF213-like [Mytilus edulis]|uniref:E3 ubiquitin-protein ligase RNF213-like n=1 Tax=Mytilus edulis TaxID=6550 RepID=UPI0039EE5ABB